MDTVRYVRSTEGGDRAPLSRVMQTRMQKVEKFFVFFITKLGMLQPLNVEVRYRSAGARRISYLFPTTKVSQVLVDYALNKFTEQGG